MGDLQNTRIGYVGNSVDLKHPADRRRLVSWSDASGATLETKEPLKSDLIVLSSVANFSYWIKRAKQPVILDLVDAYLGEKPNFLKDFGRNVLRSYKGSSKLHWITYTRHLKYACKKSTAIVVASPEQKEILAHLNPNIWVIEDDHYEIDLEMRRQIQSQPPVNGLNSPQSLLWEGLGYTLKHFKSIANDLDRFLFENDWTMYLITVHEFKRWGGLFGNIRTEKMVKGFFPLSHNKISIIKWSLENLVKYAKSSSLAIIPINMDDNFAVLKSENKLLSMWHLGLPTLCSPTSAYLRLEREIGQKNFCISEGQWNRYLVQFKDEIQVKPFDKSRFENYVRNSHSHEVIIKKWDDLLTITSANRFTP